MPNIITHKIFGEEVIKALQIEKDQSELLRIIKGNLNLFYIGTNGPDFLFFHNAKPWQVLGSHKMNYIGSELHKGNVNRFYEGAIEAIRSQKHIEIKERMIAYLFGHLCHWALDKSAHPYIFYRTGNCKGKSAYDHHRFESMMDTMMLRIYHETSVSAYPYYEICEYDEDMLQAIARIYVPSVKVALNKDIKVYDIRKSLDDWNGIHRLLFDPNHHKHKILHKMERSVSKQWMISGHIIMEKVDDTYDVLNEQHTRWYHPCDLRIVSNESFHDLFAKAIHVALDVLIETYNECNQDDSISIGELLKDQAYDSGMANDPEMIHFDLIYEGE